MNERNWVGCTVIIPGQHSLIIVSQWKKDRPDMWWWKCSNCTESSGVMSSIELEKLEGRGQVIPAEPDTKLPSEYSKHPKENEYGGAGWSYEYYD